MNNLTIRETRIIHRNFSGTEKQFNPPGRRNFSVLIDDEQMAQTLLADGWNVKPLKKRDENDPQHYFLNCAVNFAFYPPQITLIKGSNRVVLDESTVSMLDWEEIIKVALTIRPREYEVGGKKGVKAYLKTMYVTAEVDELAEEYAQLDVPFSEEDEPF